MNLTITADRLSAMLSGASGSPGKSSTRAPAGWTLSRRDTGGRPGAASRSGSARKSSPAVTTGSQGDPNWCGAWMLTLPGGLEFTVRIEPVPTFDCDHRHDPTATNPMTHFVT